MSDGKTCPADYKSISSKFPVVDDGRYSPDNLEIVRIARLSGCRLKWSSGIFGLSWRCLCPGQDHCCNEQCSDITLKSAQTALERMQAKAKAKDIAQTKRDGEREREKSAGKEKE